ncbi:hypothetical protein OFR41_08310 [Brachyspira hyodysenteriae]|uniref:hypothetical protein n=1 Tax=Brachyspira hyodysenteriae TaxID=159 RepID=UPI0022CD7661|nr:hypothetical protein [Brachyspira hyodysenteriae]MDA0035108.1 hypothetical protein [Brachyspira hyodysenteriae]MDA0049196.1 hypothetical protein [Brachyspira hyodysenteriae]MDA0064734.1 hypothetical protein [Brachyspira hyodysenteriae]MDA0087739.1 hypothetical protein [Brachyspira hyodysenteriae]
MDKLTNFEKVVLYLVDKSLGLCKVQIRKGLFLFDSLYYSFYKRSYTNCIYIKEKYGPVPNREYYIKLSNILFDYANATIECQGFYEKTSYYLKRNIELDDFLMNI